MSRADCIWAKRLQQEPALATRPWTQRRAVPHLLVAREVGPGQGTIPCLFPIVSDLGHVTDRDSEEAGRLQVLLDHGVDGFGVYVGYGPTVSATIMRPRVDGTQDNVVRVDFVLVLLEMVESGRQVECRAAEHVPFGRLLAVAVVLGRNEPVAHAVPAHPLAVRVRAHPVDA